MGVIEAIGNFFGALGSGFKLALARFTAKNAPDVKAAAVGQSDADLAAKAAKDVASGDLDRVRKGAAE